jgi:hypothetical protein
MYFRFEKAFATEYIRTLGYKYFPPFVSELWRRCHGPAVLSNSFLASKGNGTSSLYIRRKESLVMMAHLLCEPGYILHCVRNLTKKSPM